MTASPVRNLKMNDDVLVVAVSPDGKHIAVALLDNTIRVNLCLSTFYNLVYVLFQICGIIVSLGSTWIEVSVEKNFTYSSWVPHLLSQAI